MHWYKSNSRISRFRTPVKQKKQRSAKNSCTTAAKRTQQPSDSARTVARSRPASGLPQVSRDREPGRLAPAGRRAACGPGREELPPLGWLGRARARSHGRARQPRRGARTRPARSSRPRRAQSTPRDAARWPPRCSCPGAPGVRERLAPGRGCARGGSRPAAGRESRSAQPVPRLDLLSRAP